MNLAAQRLNISRMLAKHSVLERIIRPSEGDLPHDLYTFVIERALDLRHGFWGCVAAGATFKTLGRKRTPQGKAVIMRHLGELDAAETQVNEIYFAWRAGRPTDQTQHS